MNIRLLHHTITSILSELTEFNINSIYFNGKSVIFFIYQIAHLKRNFQLGNGLKCIRLRKLSDIY